MMPLAFDPNLGTIDLVGPEAAVFLHNLCTADIKSLVEGAGCETFLTNHKARVIAHLLVRKGPEPDTLHLDVDAGMQQRIAEHLNRHLISEQAEIIDRGNELKTIRFLGPVNEAIGLGPLPELANWHHVTKDGVCIRRQNVLDAGNVDLIVDRARAEQIRTLVEMGSPELYETKRIEAGWPRFGVDMDENRFVVEVNRPGAVSYTKGCYLGQEPIVMARDRGQVNRKLMRLQLSDGPELSAGTKLLIGAEELGQVTSSTPNICLAYIRRGHQEPGTTFTTEAGRTATIV